MNHEFVVSSKFKKKTNQKMKCSKDETTAPSRIAEKKNNQQQYFGGKEMKLYLKGREPDNMGGM